MFEKERAEIRVLSNIADAQRLGRARDLLRMAEHEFAEMDRWHRELRAEADQKRLEAAP
jgi:hypothetical protein